MREEGAKVEREGERKRKHLTNRAGEKEFPAHPTTFHTAAQVITLKRTDPVSRSVRL